MGEVKEGKLEMSLKGNTGRSVVFLREFRKMFFCDTTELVMARREADANWKMILVAQRVQAQLSVSLTSLL